MATFSAVGVSLAAIGYLAVTDPKRRRAFRQAEVGERRALVGWAVALLPGALVPLASGGAGFVLWLGATATLGWLLVGIRPERLESVRVMLRGRKRP
jgi:hypothetical protein